MNFKVEKVNGANGDKYACGVFSKHITLAEDKTGVFAQCVLVGGDNLKTLENAGIYLQESFENDCKKLTEQTEDILTKLSEIRDFAKARFDQMSLEAHYVAAIFYKEAVYVARVGDKVGIVVFRPPKSFKVDFELGSGKLLPGDMVLLSTNKFVENFDTGVFASEDEIIFEDVIDGLQTDIAALDEQSEVGALFVQAGVKKQAAVEIKESDADTAAGPDVGKGDVQSEDLRPVPERSAGRFLTTLGNEVKKLRVGDVGALFRLRRGLMFVAIIFVLIIGVSGFFTLRGKMEAKKEQEASVIIASAESKYSEANGIFDLNKEKARQLLVDAENLINQALSISPKNQKALGLKNAIAEKLKGTENTASINFKTFYDAPSQVSSFAKGSGNFFVFSKNGIYEVDESGKGEETSDAGADGGGFVYDKTLFTLSGGHVYKVDTAGEKDEVGSGSSVRDMAVFFGNVYLLGEKQIAKFVPIAEGYAKGADYLEQEVNFNADSRFSIDGSIWVTNGQNILQFTRGVSDDFSFSGISGVGVLGEIYTNAESDKLYVIDKANSALLVIGKDGLYEKSYNSSEFAKAVDLFVDEQEGKMYIASGSKILSADL